MFPSFAFFKDAIKDELNNHIYSRGNNPTVEILRKKIAALEKTEDALVFSSGMGAISSAVLSQVSSGDHIICVQNPYSWTTKLLDPFLSRFGIQYTYVDGSDMDEIIAAIQTNTKLLYLESPNTATFGIQDLEACALLAKKHNIVTVIDNSYASPLYQNPSEFGIDIIVHSATKYINGHSDVVAGVLCSSKAIINQIFQKTQMVLGNIISPSDAALMIRGLRTLPIRMERVSSSTLKVYSYLKKHPKVESVLFPFDPDFPQFDLAQKQMSGCGGLFSILLKTKDPIEIERFFSHLTMFLFAVSWGGHESLIMPFCCFFGNPGFEDPKFPINLVRFYIGLEDPADLIKDLDSALKQI